MIRIHIPTPMRQHTAGNAVVEVGAANVQSALDALGKHQAQFPKGQLSEEREALYVQALAMAGRMTEAKQRADRFRKTWPGSMLLPVVDSAVE